MVKGDNGGMMSDCCPDPACSHALFAAARKEAARLSPKERDIILGVLRRDELLRRSEEQRVLRLKAELQNLRRKGALKPSADWDSTTPDPDRSCGRCRVELGRVINRGAYCRSCRLKVCKGCREYSIRTTDWVCTVCHKRMEIQAASGEWMNEFVRRPSRRRDNRVYVPAADIIKRTIRRSWTISNPTPRWNAPRGSPLIRPYNSLPRGQDVSDYPSLISYKNDTKPKEYASKSARHSPALRSHSEDVYSERENSSQLVNQNVPMEASKNESVKPQLARINPLTKAAAEGKLNPAVPFEVSTRKTETISNNKENVYNKSLKTSPRHKLEQEVSAENLSSGKPVTTEETNQSVEIVTEKRIEEKRVSFEENNPKTISNVDANDSTDYSKPKGKHKDKSILKPISKSLDDGRNKERKVPIHTTQSLPEETGTGNFPYKESGITSTDVRHVIKEEDANNEQCDIEPFSGTVFRKVTVRRRRHDMRKVPAIDNGWRRGPESDILDILLPEGDDYKLVFISSDSSSKEEDVDDNDSSSTASSFLIDDCDWDYFEPSAISRPLINWGSPFGSPRVYRRDGLESPLGSPLVYRRAKESDTGTDEDIARLDSGSPASSDSTSFLARSREIIDDPTELSRMEPTVEDIALQCVHQPEGVVDPPRRELCQSCGSPTQYVPIPVPFPIPVPVPALWTTQTPLARYGSEAYDQCLRSRFRSFPRSLWPYVTQAAFIWPLITGGESNPILSSEQNSVMDECPPDTNVSVPTASERNEPTAAADREFISQTADKDTCVSNINGDAKVDEAGQVPNATIVENVPGVENSVIAATEKNENEEVHKKRNINDLINLESDPSCGHLASENANMSTDESSNCSSSDSDSDNERSKKPKVCRTYTVTREDLRESDDALPSSEVSSDCDEEDGRMSQSSVREDMSSSGSADTDSNDTGTVADKKPKRFSRVLIVNTNASSTSTSSSSSVIDPSENSDSDSSDNDTDTEKDCGIILTHMKILSENDLGEALQNLISPVANDILTNCDIKTGKNSEINTNVSSTDNISISLQAIGINTNKPCDYVEDNENRYVNKQEVCLLAINEDKVVAGTESNFPISSISDISKPTSHSILNSASCNKAKVNDFKGSHECLSTSPGLSDVSAESHHSSDIENHDTSSDDDFTEDLNNLYYEVGADPVESQIGSYLNNDIINNKKEEEVQLLVSDSLPLINAKYNASTSASIRSDELHVVEGIGENTPGERAGVSAVVSDLDDGIPRHAARYTSLVMITQEPVPTYTQVSVVTSDTTTLVPDADIIVRHTNWQDQRSENTNLDSSAYFTLTLENTSMRDSPLIHANNIVKSPIHNASLLEDNYDVTVVASSDNSVQRCEESVTVVTGADTLSAVVCLEDGLADDDSWVENLSNDEDLIPTSLSEDSSSGDEVTLTCTAAIDQEDELRGYHRTAIDFTLHTIVEESCEDSEVEQPPTHKKIRPTSATDLEKYFFFGLADGNIASINSARDDGLSETSSICSEGLDSLGGVDEVVSNDSIDPAELASSRLEKYFLSGFMGFTSGRRDSDGSVGSDSEGRPSPEQRRKRLVRARGTGRSHSSSLDNLLSHSELSGNEQLQDAQVNSEDLSSSDTDVNEEGNNFEKSEGQFDTVKRKKNKKTRTVGNASNSSEESKGLEVTQEVNETGSCSEDEEGQKTPQPEITTAIPPDSFNNRKQQSRDSGFIGSCDDLSKEQRDGNNDLIVNSKVDVKLDLERITEDKKLEDKSTFLSIPPATSLSRKDSFNNWSSDEETNLMMCKMRQFFKTMIANSSTQNSSTSKPNTPVLGGHVSPKLISSPRFKNRYKPPQLVYFENELTRLMKTVPGIRDDQVREIVEYLSSEDTWSDSYDSSDYTSSDLEGTTACNKALLQQQISDSCQEIINKFDTVSENIKSEDTNGLVADSPGLNRETAFVYQRLVASFEKMATADITGVQPPHTPHNSPPLIAKVMHHIGSRLVALMHEVSSGESHTSNSPKTRHYHRRLHPKLSNASSTTTEDDDSTSDNLSDRPNNLDETITAYNLLPRSRSHDLLLGETRNLHQSSSGVSDIAEERETSDYERFSWRGSFESALMATDSRNKLSLLGSEGSASASALAVAAKRRSAGDLMFNHKSLSREQLDRVRSCGSIGGGNCEDKLWVSSAVRPPRRRSSVPDAASGSGGSADGEDDDEDEDLENRATLPRSLQTSTATTNSLPRLPTTTPPTTMYKAHSMYHFLQQNVKSARYRPPGFSKFSTTAPKRAVSAPGLQPSHQRRGRRPQQSSVIPSDDASISEANSSPMLVTRGLSKSATPSPVAHGSRKDTSSISSQEWHSNEEDIDRLVAIHHTRISLSSLGLRSDSMASVYSGAGEGRYGTVAVRGQVEFGLQYNYKAGALEILIKQCKDLAAVDIKRNRSDPYVKVYLLPDKSKSGKRKTKVKKHTLNPVFDESLKFHITLNGLETRTLWLTVWHSDMFGRNDFLGEVMMTLENKVFDDPTPKWYNLQERTEPFEDVLSFKGDILVGLKFVPPDMTVHKKGKRSRGALHVKIKEARSLTAVKANGTSDPFCKSYLLPDKGRSSKQKTAVIRKTVNAIWNHTFIYDDVSLQELSERCLELTVWDHDRLGSNEFLGGVRFSLGTGKHYGKSADWMDSTGKELSLWKSMLERPNFWVEGCLPLRPTLDYRAT